MRLAEHPDCNPLCRACHYKDADYTEQLARKQAWADAQLGAWKAVSSPLIPAPASERLAYRSKSWLRTRVVDGRLCFGMLRAIQVDGRWDEEFVAWDRCPLHIAGITELLERLGPALLQTAPEFVTRSLMGVWIGSPHVVLISRDPLPQELSRVDWSGVLAAPLDHAWAHHNPQVGRRVFSHHPIEALHAPQPSAAQSAHPIRAFRQVAQTLLRQARAQAVDALMTSAPEQVVDLYCGTGELALLLPESTRWLGIELSSEAVRHANALGKQRAAEHVAFVGSVDHRLGDPSVRARIGESYALYINPPRTGMLPEAREHLAELFQARAPRSIAYLSCSASSLARDLDFLERQGFSVASLQSFDFFPQTEHFETLAILHRMQKSP